MKRQIFCLAFTLFFLFSHAQQNVVFYTNMGNFKVLLHTDLVPITAGNFLKLVDEKYYDSTIFHRVIDNFMIQGGDPTGTGSGGPGYSIPDEFDTSLSNLQMTISMANSGPNTGGSQFFINLVDNTYLDHDKPPFSSKHPVFGIVTDSFAVVQRIGKVKTSSRDRPLQEVRIDSIRREKNQAIPAFVEVEDILVTPSPINQRTHVLVSYDNPEGSPHSLPALVDITVLDQTGRLIWTSQVELNEQTLTTGSTHYLPLYTLYEKLPTNGLYYLTIRDKDTFFRRTRFLVINQ